MKLFSKHYAKRTDERNWTKNALLKVMHQEVSDLVAETDSKNSIWTIRKDVTLRLDFGLSRYPKKNTLELDDVLTIGSGDDYFAWDWPTDKVIVKKTDSPLSIHLDEEYEGSKIQAFVKNTLRELIVSLQDDKKFYHIVRGDNINIAGHEMSFRDIRDLNIAAKDAILAIS